MMCDESVLPEASRKLIREVADDHVSGASTLFQRTLEIFPQVAESLPASKEQTRLILISLSKALREAQPMMAPLIHLSRYVEQMAKNDFKTEVISSAFRAMPYSASRKLKKERRKIIDLALEACRDSMKVLVHSRSSMVEAFLKKWLEQNPKREVWITESRPMKEGRFLARALSDLPNRVVLLVDDARCLALNHVDAVLIGADRISETHVFNKIGSFSLATFARKKRIPTLVLSELIKFLPNEAAFGEEKNHPDFEIGKGLSNVEVFNYYFEDCQLSLFDKIVTSLGVRDENGIREIFKSGSWDVFRIKQSV